MAKRDTNQIPSLIGDLRKNLGAHRLTILAAGIAFFAFIALIPAIAAAVSITSLVANTDELVAEAESALANSPKETQEFVISQIENVADDSSTGAGIAAAIGVALSIFSASGAVGNLMESLNAVFERKENRPFLVKKGLSVALMLGALLLVASMVFTMSVLPAQLNDWIDHEGLRLAVSIGRFIALAVLMVAGLSLLYRVGPSSNPARESELVPGGIAPMLSKGAAVGALLIVALSWGFGIFVNNFGSYGETYGTLATIIVVLLWLQLMALAVLLGAEVDAHYNRRRVLEARQRAGLPAVRWTGSSELAQR